MPCTADVENRRGGVIETCCKLDGNGNRTSEEFHYSYDLQGRLLECAFAQTPSNNTPDSNGYYDNHPAQTRCRAHYEYDPGGRLYWIAHYWDTLTSGAYTSQAILGQYCDYEINTGLNRGVKLDSKYETPSSPGASTFQISQTDSYSYDSSLDYLTGASYGDGLGYATPSWSYDAAGNRNDAVTDNLNRATSIGGVTCTNDLLGNRLTSGSNAYHWDSLNRMTSYNSTTYVYRADGMRTSKSNSTGSTIYRYDGQMGMEDIDYAPGGAVSKITDYGIGARGIDGIYVTQNGSTTANYPIYDAHGNMISTLSRQGTGYATAALRTFDAWGQIRVGAQTGDPKGRYCASLGHKQDDESGLVYMRARYYEPTSGRFVSEDPSMEGRNWVVYCNDDPVNCVDGTGRGPEWIVMVFEFLRELGHAAHDPSGPNIFKIVLKTANGWQEAKLSLWSIKTIQGLYKTMMSGLEAEEATGEGATIGAWLTVMDFAYSVALVLAIDGIDFYGGNAAIDALFSEGGK